ncbi:MAG: GTP pyrophosphokinase family protein [Clostridiales bacterium]|nr:GTP pyrophosphokinase family protein [Clostridiales bacterium]
MKNIFDEEFDDELLPAEISEMLGGKISVDEVYRQAKNMMWSVVQLKELQMAYSCALKEMRTKFEVLDAEFKLKYKRNPINSITTRLKRTESIISKLVKYGVPVSLDSIEANVNDVAGIRVICPYIDDIYQIADALLSQADVTLIERKDYIQNPKPNGYRSLHLIVSIPVFFSNGKKDIKVEVQIRTIAMDFWASLEHQMKYKHNIPDQDAIGAELKKCADVIAETDKQMLSLRNRIESAEDAQTEEDILLEKLRRLDMPLG